MALFELPTLLDAAAVAFVGVFAVVGTARGALRGVLRLVALLAALVVGRFAASFLASPLAPALGMRVEAAEVIAGALVALVVLAGLGIALSRGDKWIEKARVPLLDSLMGFVLGVAVGVALVVVLTQATRVAVAPDARLVQALAVSHVGRSSESVAAVAEPLFPGGSVAAKSPR